MRTRALTGQAGDVPGLVYLLLAAILVAVVVHGVLGRSRACAAASLLLSAQLVQP